VYSQELYTGFINVNSRMILHYPSSFSYKGKFCCKKIKCAQWMQLVFYIYKRYCSNTRYFTIYFHRNVLIHTLNHKHECWTLHPNCLFILHSNVSVITIMWFWIPWLSSINHSVTPHNINVLYEDMFCLQNKGVVC
jgi:hypothetical protein